MGVEICNEESRHIFIHLLYVFGSGPPLFGPRSMGPNAGPEIHFPPSFPSISNLEDICQFSNTSIRYPKDIFPPSGFGFLHRQAEAVNRLQPWYGMCCGLNGTEEEKLCCAEQAVRVFP